jgi:hypothetical protein
LHAFEDDEMEQGQGEWRLMVQIGCWCPPHQQDLFLELVRGFKAREVPLKWRQQLMVVGEEAERGGSSGCGRKGKGKMRAAADDGVSSSDEEAARQLEEQEQEQFEGARQEGFLAAGSTGSSSSGSGSASSSGDGSSSTARRRYSRSSRTPINYSDDTRSIGYSSTRWPLGWWLICLSVCVCGRGWRSVCG